jgi:2-polyprenyl-3-methyl-5-hydroxy-6-metoxy-1,4-benzoquinol methylase
METLAAPAQSQTGSMPSPQRIFSTLTSYMDSAALRTAIDLDVFTAIAEGAATAEEIARRCNASQRGIRTLCDYLTVLEFLRKNQGRYELTPETSAFLNRHSPAYVGSAASFLASDHVKGFYNNLTETVRAGGNQAGSEHLEPEHPMWVEFARSMAPMVTMPAGIAAEHLVGSSKEPIKVLDIAAGHGLFGIMIANRNPNARIVATDWQNVLEYAKENAARHGTSGRYETIPGSAFEVDFGSGYDLVLVPNFLHHFAPSQIEELLKKIHGALKPGGRVAIVEFVPNEDRVSPPSPAAFSLTMLAGTPSGDAYTFTELNQMLNNAGFSGTIRKDLLPAPQTLLVATA